jgi:hypothetical protein
VLNLFIPTLAFFGSDMKNNSLTSFRPKHSVAILNRLVEMLDCSLARYLSYARPWARPPYLLLDALARRLGYEHESFARSIAQLIVVRRGTVRSCVFPMDFTYYNDLSLEKLGPRLLEDQQGLIASAQRGAGELVHDPEARRLVNKLEASLREYAGLLKELLAPHRIALPHTEEVRKSSVKDSSAWNKRLSKHNAVPQSAA